MIELTENQLKTLKLKLLEIMDEFDRVCRKNNIKYSLAFGTMLGAIRHKGFIPWDDDMDVIMDRENYDKFKKIAKSELQEPFEFSSISNNKNYGITFAPRVMNSKTLMVETCRFEEKWHNGIFIDIFVYDKVPNDKNSMIKNRKKVNFYSNLLTYKNKGAYFDYKSASLKKKIKRIFKTLFCILPSKFYAKKIESFKTKYQNDETKYMSAHMFEIDDSRDLLNSSSFDNYIEVEFENRKFLCIKNYDSFLTQMYGDYMKFPPENERIPHHFVEKIVF